MRFVLIDDKRLTGSMFSAKSSGNAVTSSVIDINKTATGFTNSFMLNRIGMAHWSRGLNEHNLGV